ncbi:cupin domain-containing protein [Cytobacillus gottheilii]|uniref:Cupin domain-containing protein n=1 Tax=Cytobacillus gottheilii TaxID=859144 RepID=A0ABX8FHT7_9BACI|nr:cupin domain-containing protein [Cytobacillus gottheilii]QVY63554.1 cupin domain-containing protein [Cytobacillus gottheilii]
MDYTSPNTNFSFDMNKSRLFTKDRNNYINVLGTAQLNTLENMSLLDIFLSPNNVIEPHIHQNAAELVYCISGSAIVSMLNPFSKQIQNYRITPGKVANVPQGWWHYEVAEAANTHLLAIFDAPTPEFVLGSDLLRLTPAHIMAHTYCLDENQWKNTVAPIKESTIIGPPINCSQREHLQHPAHTSHAQMHQQPYHQHYFAPYYRGAY